jgi:hypothetical protein
MVYGVPAAPSSPAYTVVDGYAVKVMLLSPILVDYSGLAALLVVAPAVLRDLPEARVLWRRQWKYASSSAS